MNLIIKKKFEESAHGGVKCDGIERFEMKEVFVEIQNFAQIKFKAIFQRCA